MGLKKGSIFICLIPIFNYFSSVTLVLSSLKKVIKWTEVHHCQSQAGNLALSKEFHTSQNLVLGLGEVKSKPVEYEILARVSWVSWCWLGPPSSTKCQTSTVSEIAVHVLHEICKAWSHVHDETNKIYIEKKMTYGTHLNGMATRTGPNISSTTVRDVVPTPVINVGG